MVHVEIEVDELGLLEFDNFHGDNKGYWDEIIVEDDKCKYV